MLDKFSWSPVRTVGAVAARSSHGMGTAKDSIIVFGGNSTNEDGEASVPWQTCLM